MFFAAFAPNDIPQRFKPPYDVPEPPVFKPIGLTEQQLEVFNSLLNGRHDLEDCDDLTVLTMFNAQIANSEDRQNWYVARDQARAQAWRWHWARTVLDSAPQDLMIVCGQERLESRPSRPAWLELDRAFEAAAVERARHVHELGYSTEHDDTHTLGQLACAAAWYAIPVAVLEECDPDRAGAYAALWPKDWGMPSDSASAIKPAQRKRELEKAMALLAAEWDRQDRLEQKA